MKVAVEEDLKLLREFGPGRRDGVHHGVLPRVERFIKAVASEASLDPARLDESLGILEFLAERHPKAYLSLAELVQEINDSKDSRDKAKDYLRRFLQNASHDERDQVWSDLADLCHKDIDVRGEVHALSEIALLPGVQSERIGLVANRLNNLMRQLKQRNVEHAWSAEIRELLARVIGTMEKQFHELSATDCSRLAWLHLNVGNEDRARDVASKGIQRDPNNDHCLRLVTKLDA